MTEPHLIRDTVRKLYFVIALLMTVLLSVVYFFVFPAGQPEPALLGEHAAAPPAPTTGLIIASYVLNLLPNLAAALLGFATVYLFARWAGITLLDQSESDSSKLDNRLASIEAKLSTPSDPGLAKFYQAYRDVEWGEWLQKAHREQVIMVNYAHTWLGNHEQALTRFFQKPNTTITIFLPNPDDPETVSQLHAIYNHPTNPLTPEDLARKIRETATRLQGIATHAGASLGRVKIVWLKQRPNYALHVIDGRWAILSVFDHHRTLRVGAPTIVLDLSILPDVKDHFDAELLRLREMSISPGPTPSSPPLNPK